MNENLVEEKRVYNYLSASAGYFLYFSSHHKTVDAILEIVASRASLVSSSSTSSDEGSSGLFEDRVWADTCETRKIKQLRKNNLQTNLAASSDPFQLGNWRLPFFFTFFAIFVSHLKKDFLSFFQCTKNTRTHQAVFLSVAPRQTFLAK